MAIKVKLRQKKISGNRQSLYLDFYPAIPHPLTGEPTRREFLGLYVADKAKTAADKQHCKETVHLAEQLRQKRENQLNKPEIYANEEKEKLKAKELGEKDFVQYFAKIANSRKASNNDNWVSALHYLNAFTNGSLKFAALTQTVCDEFKDYLLATPGRRSNKKPLSQNSAVSYFNKFKAALKQAFKDGYLPIDINAKIESIKQAETRKNFLTIEELNALVKTDCEIPVLKQAALFSALTGLRFSDIQKLVWGEVEFLEGQGYFINFMQKKTKNVEMMPISQQAYALLGQPQQASSKVFAGLTYSAWYNRLLFKWLVKAGITKDITFHCFRHTYATLQLSNGTDIYTVSKMLGHRDLKTTAVYAKIIDKTKREATNKINLDI